MRVVRTATWMCQLVLLSASVLVVGCGSSSSDDTAAHHAGSAGTSGSAGSSGTAGSAGEAGASGTGGTGAAAGTGGAGATAGTSGLGGTGGMGGTGGTGGSAGNGGTAGVSGASGTAGQAGNATLGASMPQVVAAHTPAVVIAAPKVMMITYDGDPYRADLEAFVGDFAQSTAWAAETQEYGVGALSAVTPQHIAAAPPSSMSDDDITQMLDDNLSGANPAWGAPDGSTIYTFVIPENVTFDDGTGSKACEEYDGYHSAHKVSGVQLTYAILAHCPGFDGPSSNNLEQLTVVASHEFVEAVTDPFYNKPAFAYPDDDHFIWFYVNGGELADMCSFVDTSYWKPSDMQYTVQRSWSNVAAAAGHDPCVGDPMPVYYQAIPQLEDSVTVSEYQFPTKALKLGVGETAMLTLDVLSDGPGGPYKVQVDDFNEYFTGGTKYIQASIPSTHVEAGGQISASIELLGHDPGLGNGAVLQVTTTPVSGGPSTYFYAFVGK